MPFASAGIAASDVSTFSTLPFRTSTTAFVQVLPWPSISRPKRTALAVSSAETSQQKKAINREIASLIRMEPRHVRKLPSIQPLEKSFTGLHDQLLVFRLQLQLVVGVRLCAWGRLVAQFVLQSQVLTDLIIDLSQARRTRDCKDAPPRTLGKLLQCSQARIERGRSAYVASAETVSHAVKNGVDLDVCALRLLNGLGERPTATVVPTIAENHHGLASRLACQSVLRNHVNCVIQ